MKQPFNLNSIICPSPSVDASGIGTRKSDVSIPGASGGPPRDEFPLGGNSAPKLAALRGRLTWWRSLKSTPVDFKPPADSDGRFIRPRDTPAFVNELFARRYNRRAGKQLNWRSLVFHVRHMRSLMELLPPAMRTYTRVR